MTILIVVFDGAGLTWFKKVPTKKFCASSISNSNAPPSQTNKSAHKKWMQTIFAKQWKPLLFRKESLQILQSAFDDLQ